MLIEKKDQLELPVVPKNRMWKPATRRLTNKPVHMKELSETFRHHFHPERVVSFKERAERG